MENKYTNPEKEIKIPKKLLAALFALLMLLLWFNLPLKLRAEDINQNVIRLHIRANSNIEEDQLVKLTLRDKLLTEYKERFAPIISIEEAKEYILQNKDEIVLLANNVLRENGFEYTCTAELAVCGFPQKNYGLFVFGEGEYLSLNIYLGKAEGNNWWCVLYPPLCFLNVKTAEKDNKNAASGQNEQKVQLKSFFAELMD